MEAQDIRLACLKLAHEASHSPECVVRRAKAYADFVLDDDDKSAAALFVEAAEVFRSLGTAGLTRLRADCMISAISRGTDHADLDKIVTRMMVFAATGTWPGGGRDDA